MSFFAYFNVRMTAQLSAQKYFEELTTWFMNVEVQWCCASLANHRKILAYQVVWNASSKQLHNKNETLKRRSSTMCL